MKPTKLSAQQEEALKLMREGWQLGVDTTFSGGAWLQKGGCGYGGESKNISLATVHALSKKGLIDVDKDGFPLRTYKLTGGV